MYNVIDSVGNDKKPEDIIHRGIVIDNKDPEYKCRLKVSIPGIYSSKDPNNLPWALPLPSLFLGDSSKSDYVSIPEIGSEVTIQFPFRTVESPYYSASSHNHSVHKVFQKNYPNRYGHIDSNGTYTVYDKTDQEFIFHHCSGFHLVIDKVGKMTLQSPDGLHLNMKDVLDVIVGSYTKFKTTELTVDSPMSKFNGDIKATGDITDHTSSMEIMRNIFDMHDHMHGHHAGITSSPLEHQSQGGKKG